MNMLALGFFNFLDCFKKQNFFNFHGIVNRRVFWYTLIYEIMFYLTICGIQLWLMYDWIFTWIIPITIMLYNIQFFALITRRLNDNGTNPILTKITLCLSLISIFSLTFDFFYIYEKPNPLYIPEFLDDFLFVGEQVITPTYICFFIWLLIKCTMNKK